MFGLPPDTDIELTNITDPSLLARMVQLNEGQYLEVNDQEKYLVLKTIRCPAGILIFFRHPQQEKKAFMVFAPMSYHLAMAVDPFPYEGERKNEIQQGLYNLFHSNPYPFLDEEYAGDIGFGLVNAKVTKRNIQNGIAEFEVELEPVVKKLTYRATTSESSIEGNSHAQQQSQTKTVL